MDDAYKEVYFHEYCSKCKYSKLRDDEDPPRMSGEPVQSV